MLYGNGLIDDKFHIDVDLSYEHLDWEAKYLKFINEAGKPDSLKPIVNNDMKTNTKEAEDKIKADPKLKFEMDNKLAGSYS